MGKNGNRPLNDTLFVFADNESVKPESLLEEAVYRYLDGSDQERLREVLPPLMREQAENILRWHRQHRLRVTVGCPDRKGVIQQITGAGASLGGTWIWCHQHSVDGYLHFDGQVAQVNDGPWSLRRMRAAITDRLKASLDLGDVPLNVGAWIALDWRGRSIGGQASTDPKRRLRYLGMTQSQLATFVGCSPGKVSDDLKRRIKMTDDVFRYAEHLLYPDTELALHSLVQHLVHAEDEASQLAAFIVRMFEFVEYDSSPRRGTPILFQGYGPNNPNMVAELSGITCRNSLNITWVEQKVLGSQWVVRMALEALDGKLSNSTWRDLFDSIKRLGLAPLFLCWDPKGGTRGEGQYRRAEF